MNDKTLLFDFDGTIADTLSHLVEISNRLSEEFNFQKIDPEEVYSLRDKTSQEIIKLLKVPVMKIPLIVARAKDELSREILSIKTFAGLKEILSHLKELGYQLGVLSSNSKDNVLKFLKRHRFDFFDSISTTPKIWRKEGCLVRLMEDMGIHPSEVFYITDETRDVLAAKKTGIKVVAVTWGYNSKNALLALQPHFLIDNPEDLLRIFNGVGHPTLHHNFNA